MKKDTDLDWGDDFFDGDINFNNDFDNDPYKKKSFVAGVVSGFVGGLVNQTVGDSVVITNTLKGVLPDSYTTFFEKLNDFNESKNNLIREFKEENHYNVKTLQNIAKNLGKRIDSENNLIKKKLTQFSESDFSTWEKASSSVEDGNPVFEDETHASFNEDVNRLIDAQQESSATATRATLDMSAQVGGNIVAAVKTGNSGLLGIESGMRDLLEYHRNVQYKMDKTMIEISAKHYILDARFYKFSEKANHRIIDELKKVVVNSGKSDFEKTTLLENAKAQARDKIISVVGRRVGGFVGRLREQLSAGKRKDLYSSIDEPLGMLDAILSGEQGGGPGVGATIGNLLSVLAVQSAPGLISRGPLRDMFDERFNNLSDSTRQRITEGWGRVRDYGNIASYLSTSGAGLVDNYASNWKELKPNKFDSYEDYVEYQRANGLRVMPRYVFLASNLASNSVKEGINRVMSDLSSTRSSGTQYTLTKRDSENLTSVAQWREINNITLVDVIPGLLTKIYESQEKMRTGNDAFRAPVYSYTRGQFVDRDIATKIVKNDVFPHSQFLSVTNKAREAVGALDFNGALTEEQAAELASVFVRNADQGKGFNPYDYLGNIEGVDEQLTNVINTLVRDRFNISEEDYQQYLNSNAIDRGRMNLALIRGEQGDALNNISKLIDEVRTAFPNIANRIDSNRQAGNEPLLRELGLIRTQHGEDKIDSSLILNRINEYLRDPTNPEFRGDYIEGFESNAGATRGGQPETYTPTAVRVQSLDQNSQRIDELIKSINSLTNNLTQNLAKWDVSKIDLSHIQLDMQDMPDKLDTLNKTATEQKSLLQKIVECACRTANGWGNKTSEEKQKIEREEEEGKKSLLERLKTFSPKGFFNKSIETLVNNSPLVLTGLAAGLAGYAFKDPKAAGLVAAGASVAYLYGKLRDAGSGSEPSDDENILDENGNVLLYASKLRNGDYYDVISKKVITTWKAIKGAVYDIVAKTYTTLAQLTGKLFGPDNRRLFLSGLSKAKDFAKAIWNRIDIGGIYGTASTYIKNVFYQQDVYVAGENTPRLVRKGFQSNQYYCLDSTTKKPFVITGWDKIKGPVYQLDKDGILTQIISEGEIAQGLVTASGLKLDSLKKSVGWAKDKTGEILGKFGVYAKEKIGKGVEAVSDFVSADYTSLETRLDRIYYLLCDEFGRPRETLPESSRTKEKTSSNPSETIKEADKKGFGRFFKKTETEEVIHDPLGNEIYPKKVRLNSLEDKEIKEEERKRSTFYDDVHSIKESIDGGLGGEKGEKKKKGLLGTIGAILGSGLGLFKKMFTNPLGLIGDVIGMGIGAVLKSPLRLVKIGTLLFSALLGKSSPVYKLLKWGLGGIVTLLGKGALSAGNALLDTFIPNRKKKRKAGTSRTKSRFGKGAGALALAGLSFLPAFGADAAPIDNDSVSPFDDNEENPTETFQQYQPYAGLDEEDRVDVANSILNTGYNSATALSLGSSAIAGGAKAAQTFAPGMTAALNASRYAGALGSIGSASRIVGAGASKAFLPLALLNAGLSFADSEQVGDIFDTNVINGTQRLAHTVTDFLDVGGLVSGTVDALGGALGIDTSGLQGAPTRFIDNVLDNSLTRWISKIPGIEATPFGVLKVLHEFESDLSSEQRKIRIAMYGVADTKMPLARIIEGIEQELLPFVRVSQGRVTLDKKAPIVAIIERLTRTSPAEAALWFKQRFEPIYKLWLSAASLVGYNSLIAIDKDKTPSVMKVVNQVQSAVVQFDPYPYSVDVQFSKEYPIMNRAQTEEVLNSLNQEMRIKFKEQGIDENGDISNKIVIKTKEELTSGESSPEENWFDRTLTKINSGFTRFSLIGFEEPKEVIEIDISDLHPGNGVEMDVLTLTRLAAYGDDKNHPVKVDAVLKLERYCEGFFTFKNGIATFDKKPSEILAVFKNSFQLVPAWFENWEKWFTDRFLPVLKVWVNEVYKRKHKLPKEAWKQLNATERSDIAHALIEVKVEIKGGVVDVWDIKEGPFFNTTSGDDIGIAKRWVQDLDAKRTEQQLKDPTTNKVSVDPNKPKPRMMTEEERYALYHSGGNVSQNDFNFGASAYKPNNTLPTMGATVGANGDRNYNESILPSVDSGAYGNVESTGDANYTPASSNIGGSQFNITPREAKKVIVNEFIKQGIKNKTTLAFAIANADVESSLNGKTENLNYRENVLLEKFSNFRQNPELANKYGKNSEHKANPRMIARIAYGRGKKAKDLGNLNEDDGERFIGRGFTQMTGRSNYAAVSKEVGEDYVGHPEKVGADPVSSAKSTYGYFKTSGTLKALENNDPARAANIINRGDKQAQAKKLQLTNKYLKEMQTGELKNIINELNVKNGDDKSKDEKVDSNPTVKTPDNSSQIQTGVINGLDGTNKVNVPPPDSKDIAAPPITTPAISINEAKPVSPQVTEESKPKKQTSIEKPTETNASNKRVEKTSTETKEKPSEKKQTSKETKGKATDKNKDEVTIVHDPAVLNALIGLKDAIANVMSTDRRVGVTSRPR